MHWTCWKIRQEGRICMNRLLLTPIFCMMPEITYISLFPNKRDLRASANLIFHQNHNFSCAAHKNALNVSFHMTRRAGRCPRVTRMQRRGDGGGSRIINVFLGHIFLHSSLILRWMHFKLTCHSEKDVADTMEHTRHAGKFV